LQKAKTESRFALYYELTKPKIWYLLVFTTFGAAITASNIYSIPISGATWALMIGGVAAGSAAANTLTNYHDRDIDAVMERTKKRPLPSKRIYPPEKGRNFGLVLAAISLIMAVSISFTTTFEQGFLAFVFMAFGLANNVLVYSYVLKRRSRTNIILGGLCGGAPANGALEYGSSNGRSCLYLDTNAYLGTNITFQRRLQKSKCSNVNCSSIRKNISKSDSSFYCHDGGF